MRRFAFQQAQHRHLKPGRFVDGMYDVVKNLIERLIAAERLTNLEQVRQLFGATA